MRQLAWVHILRSSAVLPTAFALLFAGTFCVAPLYAVPLNPGDTLPASAEAKPVGGTVVGTLSSPISTATFSGTLNTTVLAGDLSNSLGGLTFVYNLINSDASSDAMHRLTVSNFIGFATDVSYNPAAGVAPTQEDRSPGGDVVGFSFISTPLGAGSIPPGGIAATLVVQTNSQVFTQSIAAVIDGSQANVATLAPKAIIPEPSTMLLSLVGFALLVIRLRRR